MSNPYRDLEPKPRINRLSWWEINRNKARATTAAVYGIGAAAAVVVGLPAFFPIFFSVVALANSFAADPDEDKRLAEHARKQKLDL